VACQVEATLAEVLGNLYTDEGTVNGSKTVTFPWRSRRLSITNDSSSNDLTVTMGNTPLTLKPTESLSVKWWGTSLRLSSSGSVAYRVWVFG
jgi:hypothetical protein